MKDYHSTHMVAYEQPSHRCYTSVEVLPFLKGMKWDERALAFVHSVRPTSIRVTTGEEKTDARCWRVTVFVDDADVIQEIRQEVEVGMAPGWRYGQDASKWMREGTSKKEHSGECRCSECYGYTG